MVQLLTHTASTSIRKISPCRAVQKGLYRFLNSKKVSEDILIAELCDRSARFCQHRHILCIQDTTEISLFSQRHRIKEDSGLGRLDGDKPSLGFKMHSTLMIDALKGDCLGFANIKLWHRPLDMATAKQRKYKTLPIEQKESYKWIESVHKSNDRLKDADVITFIEDREGDIYEQLCSVAGKNVHYIIRSKANRNTTGKLKAWDILSDQPALGSYTIDLPTDHRKSRSKRHILLKVRYAQVTLLKGIHLKNDPVYADKVTINIVEAYEDRDNGLSWKLWTTHDIKGFEDAYQIVEWYSQRWMIEQLHRLLKKKGFQIEDSELESGWAIRKLCILMLSALLRIIQMNLAYNEPEGGQPIEEVFSAQEIQCLKDVNKKLQGKTVKLQNHNTPTNLKWATWIIARLGGWKGYDSQGPPGIILLKRGLDIFSNVFFGWKLAQDVGTR